MACDSRYHILKSGLLGGKPKEVEPTEIKEEELPKEEEVKVVPKEEITKVEEVKKPTRKKSIRSYLKKRK